MSRQGSLDRMQCVFKQMDFFNVHICTFLAIRLKVFCLIFEVVLKRDPEDHLFYFSSHEIAFFRHQVQIDEGNIFVCLYKWHTISWHLASVDCQSNNGQVFPLYSPNDQDMTKLLCYKTHYSVLDRLSWRKLDTKTFSSTSETCIHSVSYKRAIQQSLPYKIRLLIVV